MAALLILALFQDPSIGEWVEQLKSDSVDVRDRAQEKLGTLDPDRLPELRSAHEKARDPEVKRRLAAAIDAVEIAELGRRYALRGENITRERFGPWEPGPIVAEVLVPGRAAWTDGNNLLILLTNKGSKPVELDWFRPKSPDTGWKELEVWCNGGSRSLDFPIRRIEAGKTEAFTYYYRYDPELSSKNPTVGLSLHAKLRSGGKTGELHLREVRRWKIETREATEEEEAAVVRELVELTGNAFDAHRRMRLDYLLRRREKPQHKLTRDQLRAAYERMAGKDAAIADHFFKALTYTRPEKETLDYAVARIRGGDGLPIQHCARHLPTDLVPKLIPFLDSKDVATRRRTIQALAALDAREAGERIAALISDPEVSQAAIGAVRRLKVRCGPQLATALKHTDYSARLAAQALSAMDEKEQLPAILAALEKSRDNFLKADLVKALGKLGGPVAVVRRHLDADDPTLRGAAITALGDLGSTSDADRIATFLESRHGSDKSSAAYALGRLKSRDHVDLLIARAEGHEALAMTVVHALADIGGEEAVAAIEEFAVDRRINYDRGLARREAVRALMRVLPADQKLRKLSAILKHPKTRQRARVEVIKQLAKFGREGAPLIQERVGDDFEGLTAMWELSRLTAPKLFADPPSYPMPFKSPLTVEDVVGRFGIPFRIEGPEWLAKQTIYLYARHDRVTLENVLFAVASLRENAVGFILTDEMLRFVPREDAIEYYRGLKIED